MFAYQPMAHRHEGEVLEQWRIWRGDPMAAARLMTHAGPFVRGIHVTLHAHLTKALVGAAGTAEYAFAGRPFIRVTDAPPELTHWWGPTSP